MVIAIIGILAAIAIPNFVAHRNKALQSSVQSELLSLRNAQEEYYYINNIYAPTLEALNFTPHSQQVFIEITSADENCFEANGTMPELNKHLYIDCNGLK